MKVYFFIFTKGGEINPRLFATEEARNIALGHDLRAKLKGMGINPEIIEEDLRLGDVAGATSFVEFQAGERTDWDLNYAVGEAEV